MLRTKGKRNHLMYIKKNRDKVFCLLCHSSRKKQRKLQCTLQQIQITRDMWQLVVCELFSRGLYAQDAQQQKGEKVVSLKQSLLCLISQIIAKLDEWEKPADYFSINPWKAFSRRTYIIKQTVNSHQNLENKGKLVGKPR